LNGADVHPVADKGIGKGAPHFHDVGDDVLTKIMGGIGLGGVQLELFEQESGVKDVDAHGGQGAVGLLGLLCEFCDFLGGIHAHDAETADILRTDVHHRHGQVGIFGLMEAQQVAVVLFVDMVAGEDEQGVAVGILDETAVLVEGIGCAAVPILLGAPAERLPDLETVGRAAVQVPGFADAEMLHQGVRAELGQDGQAVQIGIDGVGEGKINDAVLTGEGYGWFRAFFSENTQAAAGSAGKDEGQNRHSAPPVETNLG